jgi:hypothetical protein
MKRDGIGRNMNIAHSLLFEGEYDEGQREGYGRAIFKNGNVYEGGWLDWDLNGQGRVNFASGVNEGKSLSGQF